MSSLFTYKPLLKKKTKNKKNKKYINTENNKTRKYIKH